jgi:hypothetical protein
MERICAMGLRDEYTDHFERQFKTLSGIYTTVNERAWRYEDVKIKGVWQWTYHTLETIEFYMGDRTTFDWGNHFGVDWEDHGAKASPEPKAMALYQEMIREKTLTELAHKEDSSFSQTETVFAWTGATYAGRLMYLLRHTQQHIGDINQVLRLSECKTLEWH